MPCTWTQDFDWTLLQGALYTAAELQGLPLAADGLAPGAVQRVLGSSQGLDTGPCFHHVNLSVAVYRPGEFGMASFDRARA